MEDQERALEEMRRVLRPGGRCLFLEHVRADNPNVVHAQDRWEGAWKAMMFGCHPNRDTLAQIESVFEVEDVRRDMMSNGPRIVRPHVLGRATSS